MRQRELLERSADELRGHFEKHQHLIRTVLEGGSLESQCVWSSCRHQQKLVSLLAETVQVLDETRKAFKSKQLEQLRRSLLRTLAAETDGTAAERDIANPA